MADGTLKFDTKIDTDGAEKDAGTLKGVLEKLINSIESLSQTVDKAVNSINFSKVDNGLQSIEQGAKEAENAVKQMGSGADNAISKAEMSAAELEAAMDQITITRWDAVETSAEGLAEAIDDIVTPAQQVHEVMDDIVPESTVSDIEQAENSTSMYRNTLELIKNTARELPQVFGQMGNNIKNAFMEAGNAAMNAGRAFKEGTPDSDDNQKIKNLVDEVDRYKDHIQSLESQGYYFGDKEYDETYASVQKLNRELNEYKKSLNQTESEQKKVTAGTQKTSKSMDKMGNSTKQNRMGMLQMLKTSLLIGVAFQAMMGAVTAVKEGFTNLALYSSSTNKNISALQTSLLTLKNSFATAFDPILTAITPALQTLIGYLSQAITTMGQFLAVFLNGATTFTKAKDAQTDYAASLKKTAKEANNALSPIDKLNVVSDSSGGGDSGAAGVPNPSDMFETVEIDNGIIKLVDSIKSTLLPAIEAAKEKAIELSKLFAEGFKIGTSNVDFKPITTSLTNIGKSLKELFTDPELVTSANNFANTAALSLGKITGSMASIGATMAELYVGSIEKYLDQNSDFIKDKLVSIFDINSETATLVSDFSVTVADIFDVFKGDNAKQIGADLFAIFENSALEIVELGSKLGRDIIDAITKPIVENKDKIKTALSNTLDIGVDVVGSIKDLFANTFASVQEAYDKYIAPAFDKMSSGWTKISSAVLDAYNEYIAPALKNASEKIREFVNGPVKEFIDKLANLVGKVVDGIAEIWDKTLAPFFAWLISKLAPGIKKAIDTVVDVFLKVGTVVLDVAGDILDSLGGLIDFIVGVFTGDWKRAWEGIKKFFKGIIDGIIDIVKPIGEFFGKKFKEAYDAVKEAFKGIGQWFKDRFEDVTGAFSDVGNWFKTTFTTAWTNIKAVFTLENAKTFFAGIWTGIKGAFGKVTDWFRDTFSEAWTAVKNVFSKGGKVFSGIKEGIADTFIDVVNLLIDGINTIIAVPFNKINSMLSILKKIPPFGTVLGGFSLPVPKIDRIPALATGAVIPPNSEFLALLGDQKRGVNIEAPLDTIVAAFQRVVGGTGSGGNITFIAQVDGKTLFEVTKSQADLYTAQTGQPAFT
jgi:phage-related protein